MLGQEAEVAARYLRVRVVDHAKEGRPAVNIKVPVKMVKWGLKMAQAFSPHMKDVDLDWTSIDTMVEEGATGKFVEVEDEAQLGVPRRATAQPAACTWTSTQVSLGSLPSGGTAAKAMRSWCRAWQP